MRRQVLLDTGPFVALIDQKDRWHSWVEAEIATIAQPLITCESVISEACFLLQRVHGGKDAVLGLVNDEIIRVPFRIEAEVAAVRELIDRYQSVPMSLADACLVRMAEQSEGSFVLTLDRDFRIYRMNRNQIIPVIMPENL